MNPPTRNRFLLAPALLAFLFSVHFPPSTAFAQGTAFTYQGRLNTGGAPANGDYDLRFTVYNAPTNGTVVGYPLTYPATVVSNGLFTVQLDFGTGVFSGANLWLEIGVETNGGGLITILSPRQRITSTPYAIQAANANAAATANSVSAGNISGTIALAQLPAVVVTNGATGVNISGTFSGNGAGVTNVNLESVNSDGAIGVTTNLTFLLACSPGVGSVPRCVVTADINGDGKVALVSANQNDNTLTVLTNNGSGGFVLAATLGVGAFPACVTAADVNGDGKVDLICANQHDNTVTVLINNGSGGFAVTSSPGAGPSPVFVTAADVNGDGKVDLICANSGAGTVTVLTNSGIGGFAIASSPAWGLGNPISVVAADVNGDGKADLIVALSANLLVVLTNDGSGGFALSSTPGVSGAAPTSVTAADVNGDGKVDLIFADAFFDTLTVLTNNGSGYFAVASSLAVGIDPASVTAADVNGDGKPDLICANYGNSTLTVLTNDGSGGFAIAASPGVGSNPSCVTAADVNGDGRVDLVSANAGNNTLTVLTNTLAVAVSFTGTVTGDGGGLTNLNLNPVISNPIGLASQTYTNFGDPAIAQYLATVAASRGRAVQGLKPPFGYNTWVQFGLGITEAQVTNAAYVASTNGLLAFAQSMGLPFVFNIDDGFIQGVNATTGLPSCSPTRFPDGVAWTLNNIWTNGLQPSVYLAGPGLPTNYYAGPAEGGVTPGLESLQAWFYVTNHVSYIKYDGFGAGLNPPLTYVSNWNGLYVTNLNISARFLQAMSSYSTTPVFVNAPTSVGYIQTIGAAFLNAWRTFGAITNNVGNVIAIDNAGTQLGRAQSFGQWGWVDAATNLLLASWYGPWHTADFDNCPNTGNQYDHTSFLIRCIFGAPVILDDIGPGDPYMVYTNCPALWAIDQDDGYQPPYWAYTNSGVYFYVRPLHSAQSQVKALMAMNRNYTYPALSGYGYLATNNITFNLLNAGYASNQLVSVYNVGGEIGQATEDLFGYGPNTVSNGYAMGTMLCSNSFTIPGLLGYDSAMFILQPASAQPLPYQSNIVSLCDLYPWWATNLDLGGIERLSFPNGGFFPEQKNIGVGADNVNCARVLQLATTNVDIRWGVYGATNFTATVGMDNTVENKFNLTNAQSWLIIVDGVTQYDSGTITCTNNATNISLALSGTNSLMTVRFFSSGPNASEGDLGNPNLTFAPAYAVSSANNTFTGTNVFAGPVIASSTNNTSAITIQRDGSTFWNGGGLMYRGGRTNALGSTSAMSVVGQGIGSLTIPGNSVTTNTVITIRLWGTYTNGSGASTSCNWTNWLGGTAIGNVTFNLGTTTAAAAAYDQIQITFESTGVNGQVRCTGILDAAGNAGINMVNYSPTTIDTTQNQTINLTFTSSASSAAGVRIDEFDVYFNGL